MKRFRFKILGAMICVFVIAIVIITALSAKAKSGILQQPGQKQNQTPDFLNQPPVATQQVKLFYATTQGQGESSETTLSSAAADGSNIVELLKLKGQIKEITPLKNGDVIFLSELSLLDRGRKIVKVHNDSESAVFTAGEGYLIDSYLLSPDEQTLLLWEVDDAPQPAVSRFLLLPVGGGEAQTILTQTPDEQTKYPLFWSQATNRIYFDSYSINRGGLHHGIFSIKADGTDFRPEHWFEEEYSNTPILSANGVWAAVASFNPAATIQLAGTSPTNGIFRPAMRNPNRIRRVNLITGGSDIILDTQPGLLYYDLAWTQAGKGIVFKKVTTDGQTLTPIGFFRVDTATKQVAGFFDNPNGVFFSLPDNPNFLFAMRSQALEGLGSPGNINQPVLKSLYFFESKSAHLQKIIGDDAIQIIRIE